MKGPFLAIVLFFGGIAKQPWICTGWTPARIYQNTGHLFNKGSSLNSSNSQRKEKTPIKYNKINNSVSYGNIDEHLPINF